MTIDRQIRGGQNLAVFARNHLRYLVEAAEIGAAEPSRPITFRSSKPWSSAEKALSRQGAMSIFFSPNGADGRVEYRAYLHSLLLEPELEDSRTKELLGLSLESTREEELWSQFDQTVRTLYVITNCRKLETPFPMTRLIKASDEEPIDSNYGYSYIVVFESLGPPPSDQFVLPEEIPATSSYSEGATIARLVNSYERSQEARRKCIEKYGYNCQVCEFNFEERFGEIGREFIHVHHLKSLAEIRGEYQVDPLNDLRPVCPNCHAMLHIGPKSRSIEDLKQILASRTNPTTAG